MKSHPRTALAVFGSATLLVFAVGCGGGDGGDSTSTSSTTETSAEPEMNSGSRLPMSAMNGLSDIRSGYLASAFQGGSPLAFAVT